MLCLILFMECLLCDLFHILMIMYVIGFIERNKDDDDGDG